MKYTNPRTVTVAIRSYNKSFPDAFKGSNQLPVMN